MFGHSFSDICHTNKFKSIALLYRRAAAKDSILYSTTTSTLHSDLFCEQIKIINLFFFHRRAASGYSTLNDDFNTYEGLTSPPYEYNRDQEL